MPDNVRTLDIQVASNGTADWLPILYRGFTIPTGVGRSVRAVLAGGLGLGQEYIEERVRTVFLNGCPVDDIDGAVVEDGDSLALAAAMPGAAGICMRRNSPYAPLRASITHHGQGSGGAERQGRVGIKLFNLVLADLGPGLLRRGVEIEAARLREFLGGAGIGREALATVRSAALDGEPVAAAGLADGLGSAGDEGASGAAEPAPVLLTVAEAV